MDFDQHCAALRDRLFPAAGRDGPLGDVPVDASFLRDLLARHGSCRLWSAAYRRTLRRILGLADGERVRLGNVPGSCVPQIAESARAALEGVTP